MDPSITKIVVMTPGAFVSRLVQTAAFKAGYTWTMSPRAKTKHVDAPALVFDIKYRYILYSRSPDQAAACPNRRTLTIGQAIKFFETDKLASNTDIDCTIPKTS